MQPNYLPSVDPSEFCDALRLCSVRGENVAVRRMDGKIYEISVKDVINTERYEGFPITRVYSSGHVFLDETGTKVYLITTQKDGKIQHQFTGGSPLEDINKNVIYRSEEQLRIHLEKVEDNAIIRTHNRTGVKIIESYNEFPLVDWALMENIDSDGKCFFKLVCLMHYIVKKYDGALSFCLGIENVTGGNWYDIEKLPITSNVAPNAYLVSKKAQEIITK